MNSSSNNSPSRAAGQQFVSATVQLAGAVDTETAHATWTAGAGHVMARIGGVLLYFLDRDAVASFAAVAAQASPLGRPVFGGQDVHRLPAAQVETGQDASIVLRLRGAQYLGGPNGVPAQASRDGRAHVTLRVGGLRLVLRDRLALAALIEVAQTALRAADVLWPDEDHGLQLPADRTRGQVDVQTR